MNTTALNNLWNYIQSMQLSKDNRLWLAQKLIEPTKEMPCVFTEDEWQEELTLSEAEGLASDEEIKQFFEGWELEV